MKILLPFQQPETNASEGGRKVPFKFRNHLGGIFGVEHGIRERNQCMIDALGMAGFLGAMQLKMTPGALLYLQGRGTVHFRYGLRVRIRHLRPQCPVCHRALSNDTRWRLPEKPIRCRFSRSA